MKNIVAIFQNRATTTITLTAIAGAILLLIGLYMLYQDKKITHQALQPKTKGFLIAAAVCFVGGFLTWLFAYVIL